MNILFEIADKDLIFIILAFVGIVLFGAIIFFVVNKKDRVEPIDEEERFDNEEKPTELFTNIKPETEEQREAKDELEKVFNQMAADLEKQKTSSNAIEEFERQQEENAIISYQELIKQAEAKRLKDNGIPKQEPKEEKTYNEVSEEPKKFKNSEIISPIFGVQNQTPKRQEPKHAYDELNVGYNTEDDDFLNSLKEFRNNL